MADEIFKLDIDIQSMLTKQAELKKSTDDLKASMKALDTTNEEGRQEFVKQEAQLKNVSTQYNANKKALAELTSQSGQFTTANEAATKAVNKQVNSIEDARKSNKELLNIRNKVNANTKEGQKAIEAINGKLNKNNEFIKQNVSGYEQQKIGIGDYEGAIKRALPGMSGMIDTLKGIRNGLIAQKAALLGSSEASGGLAAASKVLRIALISTGIGAIAVALGSLVAYLTSTQAGMDQVTKVTKPLSVIFQKVLGIVQDLGETMFEAFSNPKQLLSDLLDFMKGQVINRFKAFAVVLEGIKNFDLKQVTNGVLQATTGVENMIDKVGKAAQATKGFLSEAVDQGNRLRQIEIDIETAEANIGLKRAQALDQMKELELIAKNTALTAKERNDASQEAIKIAKQLAEDEKEIIRLKIEQEEITQSLNDSDRKDQKVLNDLKAELIQKDREQKTTELRFISTKSALQKEINAEAKKELDIKEKLAQETLNKSLEALQQELEYYRVKNKSVLDSEDELTQELIKKEEERQEQILDMKQAILLKQFEAGKLSELQYRTELLKVEDDYQSNLKGLREEYKEQQKEIEAEEKEKKEEEKALELEKEAENFELVLELQAERGARQEEVELQRLEREKQNAIAAAQKKGLDIQKVEEKFALKKEQLEKQKELAQVQAVQKTIGDIGGAYQQFFGNSKELNIALASADALIGSQKAYLSQLIPGDPTSVPRAIAASVQAASFGFANVAKIAGVQFEEGGLLEGPSHKQGGIPFTIGGHAGFEAEGGEYIVNREATKRFLPLLESLNSKYNVPGAGGIGMFQNGGIVTSQFTSLNGQKGFKLDYNRLALAVAKANESLPNPVVIVDDINSGQQRVAEVIEGATI